MSDCFDATALARLRRVLQRFIAARSDVQSAATPHAYRPWAEHITPRELEVAYLTVVGLLSNSAIAKQLFVSVKTVESHKQHVYQKCGLVGPGGWRGVAAAYWRDVGRDEGLSAWRHRRRHLLERERGAVRVARRRATA